MEQEFPDTEKMFTGIAVSAGTSCGKAYFVKRSKTKIPSYDISLSQIDAEIHRFEKALLKTRTDIEAIKEELSKRIGEEESAIFDAHLLVLEDVAIINETYALMKSKLKNVDSCYADVVGRFLSAFEQIDDPFMRERAADIRDVARRVINNLMGYEEKSSVSLQEPSILVSKDFTPSEFALIDKTKVLGIISERGSHTSHTAILARSLRVPCIVGINIDEIQASNDDTILIDGYKGCVFINPSEAVLKKYTEIASIHREIEKIFDASLPFPPETTDGHKVGLYLNIGSAENMSENSVIFSDGVGLFRTESIFLDTDSFPGEEAQFQSYKAAVEKMKGKPTVIRTLDLGGDKMMPSFFNDYSKNESNPFMGYRAIRFCLDHVDVFSAQLRAILRASAFGKVKILYPMICAINELIRANDILEQAKLSLKNEGQAFDENIEVGVMIEVPSAAMIIDLLAQHCSFISIGTNDLIQYMLAIDRVNDRVAHLYNPANPAIIRVLNNIISRGKSSGLEVSVCGEIAADPIYAILLIGMGVDNLSMSASAISEIKFILRKVSYSDLKAMAKEAIAQNCSRDILSVIRRFRNEQIQKYIKI